MNVVYFLFLWVYDMFPSYTTFYPEYEEQLRVNGVKRLLIILKIYREQPNVCEALPRVLKLL